MVLCEPHGIASHPASPVMHDGCCCVVIHRAAGGAGLRADTFASAAEALAFVRASEGCLWVDMQRCSEEDHRQALQLLFPHMQPSHVEAMLASDMYDVVELQPVGDEYVVGCLACSPSHGGPFPAAAATTAAVQAGVDCEEEVLCSFACSERVLLTLHDSLFSGLAELFRYMLNNCSRQFATKTSGVVENISMQNSVRHSSAQGTPFVPASVGAVMLSTLVCFCCETAFPAPVSLLSDVGDINEMIFLISPGDQDQTDLLRRVAVLRRRISSLRTGLFLKEKLLHQMISPAMRVSFVAKTHRVTRAYKEALSKVQRVAEKLDDARDMLNHANLNFIAGVSMRMSQASAGLDFQMNILNSVAAVCLPINLVIALFGMNLKVPFMTGEGSTLIPFWTLCAAFVLWGALCLTPLFRKALRGPKSAPIAPHD
uniref:WGS project CAEQ00000000 data, annotated contig 1251 n=1 Tax=Trypanosoma congolense (strain IL3000) TaxID=1068625 RepID=F9W4Y5_TRYCI|nr:unnamed protein product [Trypanosoma congolense IL3000]